jgi:ribonucleoside-diphosphate reductase alpha chain
MDHEILSGEAKSSDEIYSVCLSDGVYVDSADPYEFVPVFSWWDWTDEDEDVYDLSTLLEELKNVAIETNKDWAGRLGIPQSAAITCVKPSGTVSQLVDSASGIHPRYSEYYIRTVRADVKDPLAIFMMEKGFPCEFDVMKPDSTLVFSFPMKAPEGSVFRNDRSALEQLEHWLMYQRYWCEHKPSVTIYVKDEEWLEVGTWVHQHFDEMSGVSFLPHSDHTYKQAPYQEITQGEYESALELMPKDVDWSEFLEYTDETIGSQELACTGGACEIPDLT